MRDFLVFIFLLSASAVGMSTGPFVRRFRGWAKADQVKVICNGVKIEQYCDPGQICRNMSKPGVSLEKDMDGVRLTITNCSYDSQSCEAQGYIDGNEETDSFTVDVCNRSNISPQPTSPSSGPKSTSPSSGPKSTSPSSGPKSTSPSSGPKSTSPSYSPGNNSSTGAITDGFNVPIIIIIIISIIIPLLLIIIIIFFFIHYKKVECFKKPLRDIHSHLKCMNRNPDQVTNPSEQEQDIELEETLL